MNNGLRKFFKDNTKDVVSFEARELMVKAQSFNKVVLMGTSMMNSRTTNDLHVLLNMIPLVKIVETMKDNGIYITVEGDRITIKTDTMEEDEMNHEDVIYYLMDCLDTVKAN